MRYGMEQMAALKFGNNKQNFQKKINFFSIIFLINLFLLFV